MTKKQAFGGSVDDLQSMAAFARVVETGSFSAAARALDTTTSSVSKRIARLEERLGVRLLVRTTRAVASTEAGLVFHERCARILRDVSEAELAVTEMGSKPRGGRSSGRCSAPSRSSRRSSGPRMPLGCHRLVWVAISSTQMWVATRRKRAWGIGSSTGPDSTTMRSARRRTRRCSSPSYVANSCLT